VVAGGLGTLLVAALWFKTSRPWRCVTA